MAVERGTPRCSGSWLGHAGVQAGRECGDDAPSALRQDRPAVCGVCTSNWDTARLPLCDFCLSIVPRQTWKGVKAKQTSFLSVPFSPRPFLPPPSGIPGSPGGRRAWELLTGPTWEPALCGRRVWGSARVLRQRHRDGVKDRHRDTERHRHRDQDRESQRQTETQKQTEAVS